MAQETEETALTWRITASGGLETAWVAVDVEGARLRARGRAVGLDPEPYWLTYRLETAEAYVTRRLLVEVEAAGWTRRLELLRGEDGAWAANGQPVEGVDGALDCDLGRSPLTNTMPVLRHRLHQAAGSHDFTMAWVSVPDLTVLPSSQTYTHLETVETLGTLGAVEPAAAGGARVRYVGRHRGFTGTLTFDAAGLLLDYPGLGVRLTSSAGG